MVNDDQIKIARDNFRLASEEFGFEFVSPFTITDQIEAFGYISNYGSKNGVVICLTAPPEHHIDKQVVDWCKERDCFYSFLNIELFTKNYNRSYFREMLHDWGKY